MKMESMVMHTVRLDYPKELGMVIYVDKTKRWERYAVICLKKNHCF